jgi:hypothetical protein
MPQPEHLLWLENKLYFPLAVLELLLSRSYLERERELEFKERKKKSLGALKSGSTHVALAVWYNPPASI